MLVVIVKGKERTDSRASMVRSAASLIRTRGVNATSFSDVLADSGAPRGSIYHHFPGGKDQLVDAAIHSRIGFFTSGTPRVQSKAFGIRTS